jgi:hypothetical protein
VALSVNPSRKAAAAKALLGTFDTGKVCLHA